MKLSDYKVWSTKPIPKLLGTENYESVPVYECGEKLLALNNLSLNKKIFVTPVYHLRGYKNALKLCYAREGVIKLIKKALDLLNEATFLIYDAWRPVSLQNELFMECKQKIRQNNPNYTENRVISETRKYVSLPSDASQAPSPHLTGGAIDLTLCDKTGKPLPMGTDFDHFGIEARTRFYEEKVEKGEKLLPEEETILLNRRLLFHIMSFTGFTNYWEEWWHYDYGNQFWAKVKNCASIYGPQNAAIL